jgi:polysaccharide biosynthesis protein VpsM
MPTEAYRKLNHSSTPQSSNDTGSATSTPRAKPRLEYLRTEDCSPSRQPIFADVALPILTKLIALLRGFYNPISSDKLGSTPKTLHSTANSASKPLNSVAGRSVLRLLNDVLTILRVAAGDTENPRETVQPTIYVPSGRAKKACPKFVKRSIALFVLLAQGRAAYAQDERVQTPIEMFTAEEGQGLKLGNELDLNLQASLEGIYDTNVYDTASRRQSDAIAVFRPAVQLITRLPRHELRLLGDAEIRRHASLTGENSEQYSVASAGLLELGGRIDVTPEAGFARKIERRGTSGDQFLTDSPIAYHEKHVSLQVARTGGTLEVRLSGSLYKDDYVDSRISGIPVDLSPRDVLVRRANLRTSLAISEPTRIFVNLSVNQVSYDHNPGSSRDSSGYAALLGGQIQVAKLITAEAGVGYIHQSFADPAIRSVSGLNYWVSAQWTPTPKWQLTAKGEKQVEPSPRADAPAIMRSSASLNVMRAMGDRLLVEATIGILSEKYWQTPRTDHSYSADLSARYRLTRTIGLVASTGYRKRTSEADITARYDGFDIRFGVNVKW